MQCQTIHLVLPDKSQRSARQCTMQCQTMHLAVPDKSPCSARQCTMLCQTSHYAVPDNAPCCARQVTMQCKTKHYSLPDNMLCSFRQCTFRHVLRVCYWCPVWCPTSVLQAAMPHGMYKMADLPQHPLTIIQYTRT